MTACGLLWIYFFFSASGMLGALLYMEPKQKGPVGQPFLAQLFMGGSLLFGLFVMGAALFSGGCA